MNLLRILVIGKRNIDFHKIGDLCDFVYFPVAHGKNGEIVQTLNLCGLHVKRNDDSVLSVIADHISDGEELIRQNMNTHDDIF